MPHIKCDVCNSTDIIKQNGEFTCRGCGCKYSPAEIKRLAEKGGVELDAISYAESDKKVAYSSAKSKKRGMVVIPLIIAAVLLIVIFVIIVISNFPKKSSTNVPIAKTSDKNTVNEAPLEGFDFPEESENKIIYNIDDTITDITVEINGGAKNDVTIRIGESYQLIAHTEPESSDKIAWRSENTSVVTVNSEGVITAVGNGRSKVIAYAPNGVTGEIVIRVTSDDESAVTHPKIPYGGFILE